MTDNDRNTRTLIVAFTIAIFALVPLRFVEVGQQMESQMNARVLGQSAVRKAIVLPDAQIKEKSVYVGLEAPYREQLEESKKCILKPEASSLVKQLQTKLATEELSNEEAQEIADGIKVVQKNTCKK